MGVLFHTSFLVAAEWIVLASSTTNINWKTESGQETLPKSLTSRKISKWKVTSVTKCWAAWQVDLLALRILQLVAFLPVCQGEK